MAGIDSSQARNMHMTAMGRVLVLQMFSHCGGETYDVAVTAHDNNVHESTFSSTVTTLAGGAASPRCTTIPSATQIVDSNSSIWTVAGGAIYEDEQACAATANVILLLYCNGLIYQENSSHLWWFWNGASWVGAGADPRPTIAPAVPTNLVAIVH